MAQRLSTSATFQALEARVTGLEQISPLPSTLENNSFLSAKKHDGTVTRIAGITEDNDFYLGGRDAPLNSIISSANMFRFDIAGSSACNIAASGLTANGLNAPTISIDANFYSTLVSSNPAIMFDSGDTLSFNRGTNSYSFALSNSAQLSVNAAGTFVANVLTIGDGNFGLSLNGGSQPLVLYDSGDYTSFVRSANTYSWVIGNATKATLDGSGNFIAYGALLASGDANFGLSFTLANNPRVTFDASDNLSFDRLSNSYTFNIAGTPKMQLDAAGSLSNTGFIFPSGDTNFLLGMVSGSPRIQFDANDNLAFDRAANIYSFNVGGASRLDVNTTGVGVPGSINAGNLIQIGDAGFFVQIISGKPTITFDSGDTLTYDRTANKYYFAVAGVNVASIDASGNMRLKGSLTQSVTP